MNLTINAFGTENSINVTDQSVERINAGAEKKSIFAGDTNLANDPIALRRKEAQEQAWNIVKNAWDNDKSVDNMMQSRREHYAQMLQLKEESLAEISGITEEKELLREMYGVDAESQEQKDVELLQKAQEINACVSKEELTDEERKRLGELYQGNLTEYQSRVLEQNKRAIELKKQIADADRQMQDATADIYRVKAERLKSNPMLEAQNAADEIMEAANEEIIGMLVQESKEFIDEKMEEAEEKAQAMMEEREEREKQLEETKLKRAMQEAFIEGNKEAVNKAKALERRADAFEIEITEMVQMTRGAAAVDSVERSLDGIKNSMSLLEIDLKGIKVDDET